MLTLEESNTAASKSLDNLDNAHKAIVDEYPDTKITALLSQKKECNAQLDAALNKIETDIAAEKKLIEETLTSFDQEFSIACNKSLNEHIKTLHTFIDSAEEKMSHLNTLSDPTKFEIKSEAPGLLSSAQIKEILKNCESMLEALLKSFSILYSKKNKIFDPEYKKYKSNSTLIKKTVRKINTLQEKYLDSKKRLEKHQLIDTIQKILEDENNYTFKDLKSLLPAILSGNSILVTEKKEVKDQKEQKITTRRMRVSATGSQLHAKIIAFKKKPIRTDEDIEQLFKDLNSLLTHEKQGFFNKELVPVQKTVEKYSFFGLWTSRHQKTAGTYQQLLKLVETYPTMAIAFKFCSIVKQI
jgi:hypothetical protein